MDVVTILLIAFGLAMDAFAVSVTNGITIKHQRINQALRIAFCFGGFQALMPLIGWWGGLRVRDLISGVDHWIAFGLLSLIGGKMIYESLGPGSNEREAKPLTFFILLSLGVATSLDALAVGMSFAFLSISIVTPILVIGVITFLISLLGVFMGNKIGHFFENKIEIVGGLVLIGIGIKILIQDLTSP